MNAEFVGLLSGLIVIASAIPYGLRTYQGKVQPNLTSWSLWTLIGLAILLTYKSSGAEANIWPAVFGFISPLIITVLVMKKRGGWKKPDKFEMACLVFGLISLGLWLAVHESKELSQWALILAIVADMFAAIPTVIFVWKHPGDDRPFAWSCYAVGYGLGMFAITEHSFANYILPAYMFLAGLTIAAPLALHRIRTKTPLSEWA